MNALYEGKKIFFDASESKIFSLKSTLGREIKLLTPQQMSQRFRIALALLKVTIIWKHFKKYY